MASLLSRVVLGAGVAAATMVCDPAGALAQPDPTAPVPSAADKATAKKLVDEGIAAQDAKEYDKAIELYRQAYGIVPHPILLFNIGQCYRLAGRPENAKTFYERYLERDPNGSQVAAANAALAAIHASTGAGSGAKPVAGEPRTGAPVGAGAPPRTGEAGQAGKTDTGGGTGATPAPPTEVASTGPATEGDGAHRTDTVGKPGRTLRLTGLAMGGVGLVSAAVGIYFTTQVSHWEDEAAKEGPPFTSSKSKGESAQRNQDIAYVVGGALVFVGAVTYWIGHRKGQEDQTTAWTPVVGDGFAGFAVSGVLP
jgi:Tetratricopeptide repeat